MENKNYFWRPVSEYTGGRVLATNGLDVIIGEINSDGDCESEEDSGTILCGITGFIKIEEMLPELKESEDERIKKQIIYAIKELHVCDETKRKCIAWLEKQGEKKPAFEMKTPEESLGIDSDTYNKIVDECVYGEQKPWSEEDELRMENILSVIEGHGYPMEVKWLKSIKGRHTWKPSDEQMDSIKYAIDYLSRDTKTIRKYLMSLYEDLKKLKEE